MLPFEVGFPSESGGVRAGEAGRGGQVCLAVPARFSFPATFATPRLIMALGGRSARQEPRMHLVPPYALPTLASISGELKSCFTDAIHGGRCSLITAALHVLLGTDCKARHPPTPHPPHPAPFGGVWNSALLKSAGRCRLVIQLVQWRRATSVTVIFFLIFLSGCRQQVRREKRRFFFILQPSTAQL